jgi:hypothetical protein
MVASCSVLATLLAAMVRISRKKKAERARAAAMRFALAGQRGAVAANAQLSPPLPAGEPHSLMELATVALESSNAAEGDDAMDFDDVAASTPQRLVGANDPCRRSNKRSRVAAPLSPASRLAMQTASFMRPREHGVFEQKEI